MIDGWTLTYAAVVSYILAMSLTLFFFAIGDWSRWRIAEEYPQYFYWNLIVPLLVVLILTLVAAKPERGVAGEPELPPDMLVKRLSDDDPSGFRFFSAQHRETGQCFLVLGLNSGASIAPAAPGVCR